MRDYDPTTGRYLQADPLGLVDGPSVYGYALQNPGRWSDPWGLYVVICRSTGGVQGYGEVGYEQGDFHEGSRKRCNYVCTRQDTGVTKEFESCGLDMKTGDQCIGVPYFSQSLPNPPYSTTVKTGQPPQEFNYDTSATLWKWLFEGQSMADFGADVQLNFGAE